MRTGKVYTVLWTEEGKVVTSAPLTREEAIEELRVRSEESDLYLFAGAPVFFAVDKRPTVTFGKTGRKTRKATATDGEPKKRGRPRKNGASDVAAASAV